MLNLCPLRDIRNPWRCERIDSVRDGRGRGKGRERGRGIKRNRNRRVRRRNRRKVGRLRTHRTPLEREDDSERALPERKLDGEQIGHRESSTGDVEGMLGGRDVGGARKDQAEVAIALKRT